MKKLNMGFQVRRRSKMTDNHEDNLNESLVGYKHNITPIVRTTLTWQRDLVFTGATPQGYEIEFDAHAQWGCKPTEALLLSLAGCMGMDIVSILTKMRITLASFRIEIEGMRNPVPPQYYKSVTLVLHIAGQNLDAPKVERAVTLSREKYCSVYNSLRPDLELNVRYFLEEKNHSGDNNK
jgi:putative redox protein